MSAGNQWQATHLREGRELIRSSIQHMKFRCVGVETCDASGDKALSKVFDRLEKAEKALTALIHDAETIYGQRTSEVQA